MLGANYLGKTYLGGYTQIPIVVIPPPVIPPVVVPDYDTTIIRFEEPARLVQVKNNGPLVFKGHTYNHMDSLMMTPQEFEHYQDKVEFVSGFDN